MATTNATKLINCTDLDSRSSFTGYVHILQDATDGNFTLLNVCQAEVCNVLWGTGNPEISGIGVLVGYIFESVLGFFFALGLEVLRSKRANYQSQRSRLETRSEELLLIGCNVFFDCAVPFVGSILIASVVFLIARDYNISADGLGALTVQMMWTVACLSMLPLLYPLIMLRYFIVEGEKQEEEDKAEISKARHNYRWFVFCVLWIPLLYIFISQMIGDFAPSQIGRGNGGGGAPIVTDQQWEALINLCFTGVQTLGDNETNFIKGISIAGSVLVSTLVLCRLCLITFNKWTLAFTSQIKLRLTKVVGKEKLTPLISRAMLTVLLFLTISQIWAIFRFREVQDSLAVASGGSYMDNKWTFGQVVSLVIFLPVFIELIYCLAH